MLSGSAGLDPSHEDAAGGRIGVLAGPDGILMVDAQYAELGDKVLAAIRRISAAPIRFLVNTHIHRDHTGGNAYFAKLGATIFAREELRAGMSGAGRAANGGPAPASEPAAIPVVTYGLGEPVRLHMNGEIVDLVPIRAAHTGGDTMIRFEKANAIMIGDYYRNFGYPFIDIGNGGSLKGMLEALDFTMKAAGPGHAAHPGPRHPHQARRARSLSRHDLRRAEQGAADGRAGQEPAGRAGRAPDRALRRERSGRPPAGRRRHQRRPFRHRGVSGAQGRQVIMAASEFSLLQPS